MRGIYNCTITDWNQVGGSTGPIQRYFVQTRSGTRSFIISGLLGFDPTTIDTCRRSRPGEHGSNIPANGDQETEAIFFFSVANWTAMSQGTITPTAGPARSTSPSTTRPRARSRRRVPVRSVGGGQFEPRFADRG